MVPDAIRRSRAHRAARRAMPLTWGVTLAWVPDRASLPEVLNRRGLLGVGYEVGVQKGAFSEALLDGWRGRRLVSVDGWSVKWEEDPEDPRVTQEVHDAYFETTRERLRRFGTRSEVWRASSLDAAARVDDASADFVYLDARHDYESVVADIAAWAPKVRPGGMLAGHDYHDGPRYGQQYGVKTAVDEFCRARGLRLALTRRDHPEQSWMVFLPRRR